MAQVLQASLNTVRLGSARAVMSAWIVLALVAVLAFGAVMVSHGPVGADAVRSQCHVVAGGLDCSGSPQARAPAR